MAAKQVCGSAGSRSRFNAYEIPGGFRIKIGHRTWEFLGRMVEHPHIITFKQIGETDRDPQDIEFRQMYPSELQNLIDAGIHCSIPVRFVTFSQALAECMNGRRITREGWNGKGMWVAIQLPTKQSKMDRPYLFMQTVNEEFVPWVASQSDLLASDWIVLENDSATAIRHIPN